MTFTNYTGADNAFLRHSVFDRLIADGQATRVLATDEQGEWFAWQLSAEAATELNVSEPDRLVLGGLRAPSAAKLAEMATVNTAETTRQQKLDAARTIVRNQVARVKAIAPASRNDQDRWLLALSLLALAEE